MSKENCSRRKHRRNRGITLKRRCRSPRLGCVPLTLKDLFPHLRIVTDPDKLAQLKAEVARRKQIAGRNCKAAGYRPNACERPACAESV